MARVSLVIPAAGSGTRFGSARPKQMLALAGVPVLRRSIDAFVGFVDEVVIPTSADLVDAITQCCTGLPFPVRIMTGGATRQASVAAGIRATDPQHAYILVHDAVRPFVPRRCIADCIAALGSHDAAVVAIACSDTVKRTDVETPRRVAATLPRDGLWLAQTPQGLRREIALAAFALAENEGWLCSDDVQVIERVGGSITVIPGDRRNFKITTPEDWALAEALVALTR
jgi:2-C-methyl-D-erythritol 4-phosphate cytidylyltransferase